MDDVLAADAEARRIAQEEVSRMVGKVRAVSVN
jgi:hypothetical protein